MSEYLEENKVTIIAVLLIGIILICALPYGYDYVTTQPLKENPTVTESRIPLYDPNDPNFDNRTWTWINETVVP